MHCFFTPVFAPKKFTQLAEAIRKLCLQHNTSVDNTDIVEHAILSLLGIQVPEDFECHIMNNHDSEDTFLFNMKHDPDIHDRFVTGMKEKFPGVLIEALPASQNKQSEREGSKFVFLRNYSLNIELFTTLILPHLGEAIESLRTGNEAYRAEQARKESWLQLPKQSEELYYSDDTINHISKTLIEQSEYYNEARSLISDFTCTIKDGHMRLLLPAMQKDSLALYFDKGILPSQRQNETRDIFDSLAKLHNTELDSKHISILWPYNVGGNHWVSIEVMIVVDENQDAQVSMAWHDPYQPSAEVNSQLKENLLLLLEKGLQRIKIANRVVDRDSENLTLFTQPRQEQTNVVSCGPIVCTEIIGKMLGRECTDVTYNQATLQEAYALHKSIQGNINIPQQYQAENNEEQKALEQAMRLSMGQQS